jgi:hypothetical protein
MVKEYKQRGKFGEYQLEEQEIEAEKQKLLNELGIALYEINRYNPPA